MTGYQEAIQRVRTELALLGFIHITSRHVEAYMRLRHPTLDNLSPDQFKQEVIIALAAARKDGKEAAEQLAQSFGL